MIILKKYLVLLIIIISCMHPIKAYATEYQRTIDYRYNMRGYTDYYMDSDYTQWREDRNTTFEDNNTDNFIFTREGGGQTKAVTTTSVVAGQDGSIEWTGNIVSGWTSSAPYLAHFYCDYIYESTTSEVDTNYTISVTGDKPGRTEDPDYYKRGTFSIEVMGINRLTDEYQRIQLIQYVNTQNPNTGYTTYGKSVTITGDDGYNYKGYVIRVHMYCVTTPYVYKANGTLYKLWTVTNSLDNFTPEVNYGEQLDNINGTLGSIYNAIVNIPTTIVNEIRALPTTIIDGIKHIFIYDDWEQDLRNMADEIEIPYVNQLVRDVGTILQYFTEYNPNTEIHIRIPKIVYNNGFSINGNMTNETIDIEDITEYSVDGYNIVTALRTVTSFGAMMFILSLAGKFLIQVGIEVDDYLHPVIKTVLDTGEVDI